jgi:flagellar assembly protein FliH
MAAEQSRLRDLRLNFRALDEAAMGALAQDISATVLALCNQVLGEYAADEKALEQRCHAAARRLGSGARDLTLTLNPETFEALETANFPGWTLETDAALFPGELRLSGPQGAVREGPEDWRRAIAEALGA